MCNWIRIVKEFRIFITIIFNLNLLLITYLVWKVISDTVTVTDMSLITQLFNLFELRILIKDHYGSTKRYRIEQESNNSSCYTQSHLLRKMLLWILQLEEMIIMLQVGFEICNSTVRIFTTANVRPHYSNSIIIIKFKILNISRF